MITPASPQAAPPVLSSHDEPYAPPRVETLGSVEELTRGGGTPGIPDISNFGSVTISDRRLKEHIAAVDCGVALDRVASLTLR